MKTLPLGFVALLGIVACGDDTSSGGSPSTGGAGAGGDGNGGSMMVSGGAGGIGASGAEGGGGSTTGGGGSGGSPACAGLPMGRVPATAVYSDFQGSEDLAFDGDGGLVAKNGGNLVRIDASLTPTTFAPLSGTVYGLRFAPNGDLFAARNDMNTVVKVVGGTVTTFAMELGGPNGVHVDSAGNVWVTEFGAGRVLRLDPNGAETVIASNLDAPNGVILDETRNLLFFTEYFEGRVFRVDPAGGTPTEVVQVGGALDGLELDACGNLYVVDNQNDRIYRIDLDADANLIGEPVLLAVTQENIANAQFGRGPGWNATSLYAAGNPGVVYEIPVGVPGAF
jgi:streptogramin lyase